MAETLFGDFVEQIETAVDAVATQFPYTREQIVSIALRQWKIQVYTTIA